MKSAIGVACVAGFAIVLDLLVAGLLLLDVRAAATIDAAALVHDGGHSWRTPGRLLHGRFISAAGDDGWALVDGEAALFEDDRALEPVRASHQRIRDDGAGAWSYWHGQVYLSSSDGSDPAANGRRYWIEAPWRPTPLLAVIAAACTLGAFLLLRRRAPRFRHGSERLMDVLATRFPDAGPHPLLSMAPWLLAAAVAITFASPSAGEWFPWDFADAATDYIPPYLGWADAWITGAFALTIVASRTLPGAGVVLILAVVTLVLAAGGWNEGRALEWRPQITGLVLGGRFSLAFLAAWCVTRAGGARALSPAVALIAVIWLGGVVLGAWQGEGKFIQVGGHFPSFAGMVLGLVIVYSIRRGAFIWAAVAAVGLVATGSRTALLTTALALVVPWIRFGRAERSPRAERTAIVASSAIMLAGLAALLASPQLRAYFALKLRPTNWLSLGRRLDMIQWVFATMHAGGWRWLGWGCGRGPAFMSAGVAAGTMPEHWGNLHVVWLEWLVELGAFVLPLAAIILWRAAAAWWRGPALAAALWLFFLFSQSLDYWLWARDGVILWGLFLGLAEGMAGSPRGDRSAGASHGAQAASTSR